MDVEDWRAAVCCDWRLLEVAPLDIRSDRAFVRDVVRHNGAALELAAEELKSDQEIVLEAAVCTAEGLLFADAELRRDRHFMLEAAKRNELVLAYAHESLIGDREFMLSCVQVVWKAFRYASEALRDDRALALVAARKSHKALGSIAEEFHEDLLRREAEAAEAEAAAGGPEVSEPAEIAKSSRNFVVQDLAFMLDAVTASWKALEFAAPALKGNAELVLAGVKQNPKAIELASPELRTNRPFMASAVKQDRASFAYIPPGSPLAADREFWLTVVKQQPDGWSLLLKHATPGPPLASDRELVSQAVASDWRALAFGDEDLRGDPATVMAAVQLSWEAVGLATAVPLQAMMEAVRQDWRAVEILLSSGHDFSDEDLAVLAESNPQIVRADPLGASRATMLAAVHYNGLALQYASPELCADREMATLAVSQNWRALKFASDSLRGSKPLVKKALRQSGLALQHASEELRGDQRLVVEALKQNIRALRYVTQRLMKDEEFWVVVGAEIPGGWKMCLEQGLAETEVEQESGAPMIPDREHNFLKGVPLRPDLLPLCA